MSLLLLQSGPQSISRSPDTVAAANLQFWFKADSLALADNAAVTTWEDSFGTNDATQAVAGAKPTFKEDIFGWLPAVRGDGGDHLTLATPIELSGAYTLYAVGNRATSQKWIPTGHPTISSVHTIYSDNIVYVRDDAGGQVAKAYTGSAGNIITRFHRSAVGAAIKFRATGMAEGDVGILGTMTIGTIMGWPVSAVFTLGDFTEILLWNVALTSAQMASVEAYLSRWGVSI